MLIATSPDWADSMNHMTCFEVASAGDDGVADGTAADSLALLVNLRTALRVNGAICAHALVKSPVSGGDNGVSVLLSDVADNEAQCCLPDCCLCGHAKAALSGLTS